MWAHKDTMPVLPMHIIQNSPTSFQAEDCHTFTDVEGVFEAFGSSLRIENRRILIDGLEIKLTCDPGHIGGSFWLSSIAMLMYMRSNKQEFAGKRVLELGAGTALPSIYLSKACCDMVVASDLDIVPALHSIGANPCRVIPVTLDWSSESHGLFDVVVACDCVYRANHESFARAVLAHLAPGGTLYMVNPQREGFDECLYLLEEQLSCHATETEMQVAGSVASITLVKAHKD